MQAELVRRAQQGDVDAYATLTAALIDRMPAASEYDVAMAKPRFTMVVLLVEDMAASVGFYRRLGVDFPDDAETRRDVLVDIGDGRTIVWSTTFAANDPDRERPRGGSRIMLEFFVEGHAAVDEKFAELEAAGYVVQREPYTTNFGAYMCLVDDPDGNTVLVTAG